MNAPVRKFKKFQELPETVRVEMDKKLLSDTTVASVARWLQDDLQMLMDLKPASLKKNLERYRSQDLKKRVLDEMASKAVGISTSTLHRNLQALDELENLAGLQKKRMESILIRERDMPSGILLKQASDEVKVMKEILVEISKLQLETGIIRRAPKSGAGTLTDPSTGITRTFTWSEEQEALYRDLELIEGTATDVTQDEENVPDR